MIEHTRHYIAQPLSNADRKRAYLIKLVASSHYDEQDHAWRVADGIAQLRRLQRHWQRRAKGEAMPKPQERQVLTLRRGAK